ncbi:MAG TPA: sialidase family protein [Pyrinomonadaceae bacterium]|jgi:sialidase-1
MSTVLSKVFRRSACAAFFIAFVVFPVLAQTPEKTPPFVKTTVWKYLEDGYLANHVHALVLSKKGTLLAFSEGRVGPYDGDPSNLIMKRSADNGATWSDDALIERTDGRFYESEGVEGKQEAWVNPVAVVDQETGRIFVFYALNEGSSQQKWTRVFYRYSDDDGVTWLPKKSGGARVEITSLLKDNQNGWTLFMPGPGHGIQLARQKDRSKNGRLLVQFWNRRAINERPRNYGVVVIYSDDNGKTWKRGGETRKEYGENESRLLELSDGRILLNARGSEAADNAKRLDTRKSRLFAYSTDAGASFSSSEVRPELNYTNIDSGLAAFTDAAGRECVLFSHPDDVARRIRLTVSVSCDDLKSWSQHRLVDEGIVGYSDLVVLPDKTIGVLYGARREQEPSGLGLPTGVMFARFSFEWLMQKN